MKKTVRRVLFYVMVLVVLVYLADRKFHFISSGPDSAQPALASSDGALPVTATIIKPEPLDDKLIITGALIANEAVEIASEVSGVVQKIYFKEGSKVKKGDLLLTLNTEDQEAQLEKLKFSKKLRETSEYRQRQLLEKEAISQEEYDVALTELNTASADIKVLEAQIAKSKIRAPFNGTIGLRYISDGAFINSSSRIASLININPIKVEFSIPGKYGTVINDGDPIFFTTDASEKTYQGTVYAVEPQIDQATRTMRIRATSDNSKGELFPGLFTRVEVVLNHKDNALMVPSIAVVNDLAGHKVFLERGGKVVEQPVTIGIRTANSIEIIEGIKEGDTVITSGLLQIRPNSVVEITDFN
ncbi:MAG: efflux RND transporter periplasmic adaptor subunit [Imperialibacter sp.]|uniref:efflux RND transporter periplasmic adaptor subunit n=1 Tax=Imperialibacter sp. TaxID=2038411 RepID=UPI003A8ABF7A